MKYFQYQKDLGENAQGKRLSSSVYVNVEDIAYVSIHNQYQKAEIYPKVGTVHTIYGKADIDKLREFCGQERGQA